MNAECYCGRWMCGRCGWCHDCDGLDSNKVARQIRSCQEEGRQPEYDQSLAHSASEA